MRSASSRPSHQGDRRAPVVGKPVQWRSPPVTVRAGGNPEPIVQAPSRAARMTSPPAVLYIDDFKQGISPKSLVSHRGNDS